MSMTATTETESPSLAHQRFAEMIGVIEQVPEDEFDIGLWRCGSVACVTGHTAMHFASEGWRWETLTDLPIWRHCRSTYESFAMFFRIPRPLAEWICSANPVNYDGTLLPSYCEVHGVRISGVTPAHAADRMRKVLEMVTEEAVAA